MEVNVVQTLQNLGVAGFAIFILYKMFLSYQARSKEKDTELIQEIDKRDKRNDESQKVFHEYAKSTQESMTKHINDNTRALNTFTTSVQENTKIMQKVNDHLMSPHSAPVINQVTVEGNKKHNE